MNFNNHNFVRKINYSCHPIKRKKEAITDILRGLCTLQMDEKSRDRLQDTLFFMPINREILMDFCDYAVNYQSYRIFNFC